MTITLSGEPLSTQGQQVYRSVCRGRAPSVYMTPRGKALKTAYQWEAKSQWKGGALTGDVQLSVTFYFGTKRKTDLDNFNKLWQDALTGVVYEDDSQINQLTLIRAYDKDNPRIEIEI